MRMRKAGTNLEILVSLLTMHHCGGVFVVVWCCCFSFCGGVPVFVFAVVLWLCFCGGGGVFVVVFLWCFSSCGGVFVVVWWCFCGGAAAFLWWWYFCGGGGVVVFVFVVVWYGGVFVKKFLSAQAWCNAHCKISTCWKGANAEPWVLCMVVGAVPASGRRSDIVLDVVPNNFCPSELAWLGGLTLGGPSHLVSG